MMLYQICANYYHTDITDIDSEANLHPNLGPLETPAMLQRHGTPAPSACGGSGAWAEAATGGHRLAIEVPPSTWAKSGKGRLRRLEKCEGS